MGSSGTGKNGEGKPRRRPCQSKLVPAKDLLQIEEWHLMGVTGEEIARRLNMHGESVRGLIKKKIEPRWRAEKHVSLHRELSKIDLIERIAWKKFLESEGPEKIKTIREVLDQFGVSHDLVTRVTKYRTGEQNWLDFVKWAVEMRAKLGGLLVNRHEHRMEVGIRVAGLKPEELTATILENILTRAKERRLQREALETLSEDVV